VIAYVRRAGDRAVLVVANLGDAPLDGVTLSSTVDALPAGQWTLRSLVGGSPAAPLRVPAGGTFQGYVPLRTLAPRHGQLFALVPVPVR
jgi:hypothetical protein